MSSTAAVIVYFGRNTEDDAKACLGAGGYVGCETRLDNHSYLLKVEIHDEEEAKHFALFRNALVDATLNHTVEFI